jgi:phage tail-like protein
MPLPTGDAVANNLFGIEIDGVTIAQFREVAGITSTVTPIEHRENTKDGVHVIKKLPGNRTSGDITLRRGKTQDAGLWKWFKQVQDGDMDGARRNGSVVLFDFERGEVARYNFLNGWPTKLSITNLAAPGNEVLIEECVITHEGLALA